MINAGLLNRRVTIESVAMTPNDYGERRQTWSALATVWGQVEPVSAREAPLAKSFAMTTSHIVRIRYRDDVTAKMRLKVGARILTIDGILDRDDAHAVLDLYCSEQS